MGAGEHRGIYTVFRTLLDSITNLRRLSVEILPVSQSLAKVLELPLFEQ